MKQIVQYLSNGQTEILEVPTPQVSKGKVLVKSDISLVSYGTEKMLINFGKSNYISKALQQPDKVKGVIAKLKNDGIYSTYDAVKSKLDKPIPLGYSNVGTIIEIGEGVENLSIGDRVVSNGNHAEVVCIPINLCTKIPDNVSNELACFTVLASIGLQGVRLSKPTIGEKFVVIGLGLIGLLTVQILSSHGCKVLASDIDNEKLAIAKNYGAEIVNSTDSQDLIDKANSFSESNGVDAVIITATTKSNEIIDIAPKICRQRGRIVLVGVTGLNLSREEFYRKEIKFQVSCSYGPGRYDNDYEEKGNDYPLGFVRWTEKRNFETILQLMRDKKIKEENLVSKRIKLQDLPELYGNMRKSNVSLGILIEYEKDINVKKNIEIISPIRVNRKSDVEATIAFIGAGNYASRELIPAFKKTNSNLHTIVSESGLSSTLIGSKSGFKFSSTDLDKTLSNEEINTVVVVSRHDTHAEIVKKSLIYKKNIFVEKPLAINKHELNEIKNLYYSLDDAPQLMVGFNRRFSPHIIKMKELIESIDEPKSFIMTMNAGHIPKDHWVHDYEIGGGRIIGEACHYVDLMRYLVGYEITSITSMCMSNSNTKINEDKMSITIGFKDGSFGTIHYFSNGSNQFPKERIEVFTDGKILQLDNFIKLRGFGWNNFNSMKTWQQDKGQLNCVKQFLKGLKTGNDVIPIDQIFEVANYTIEASHFRS